MKTWIIGFLIFITCIQAQQKVTPQLVQQELDTAEADFNRAVKMFNPWYTGPILAASASMMPVGDINFQPYLYLFDNYAAFNKDRHSVDNPDLWVFNPNVVAQTGITSWMDTAVVVQTVTNFKHSHSRTFWGDTYANFGFKICDQTVYRPKMKIAIAETFPTGTYQNLSAHKAGVDATGVGSFVTGLSFRLAKVLFWWTQHPLSTRLVLTYNIPSWVHVKGLNVYGGGKGTNGHARPGQSFQTDLGLEWAWNQNWVLATDIVYQTTGRTKFTGKHGTDPATGKPFPVGGPSSDYLQLAPAIEYNWNESLGAIAGVWFTVWGRNTSNFLNYVFSVTYTFTVGK